MRLAFVHTVNCFFVLINAFPFIEKSAVIGRSEVLKLQRELEHQAEEKRLLFDSLTTPIEVTGEHGFMPPDFAAGDQRGPCPGLNALANHGYIERNGVTSLLEAVSAVNTVYGMSIQLAQALAVMGTVFVGNPLSLSPGFSIGGATDSVSNLLNNGLGLLGTPRGLIGSHNLIESDSSLTRDDLYVTGDASTMNMELFMAWYNTSTNAAGSYDLSIMADIAGRRFKETVATNPNFYYGPFTGTVARNAGYIFATRLLANHSSEFPDGALNRETMKSFWGVTGSEGNLTYNRGWERIPVNWYRTPVDYTITALAFDTVAMVVMYPEMASMGGNTGTVNSFVGIDPGNLTSGVLNAETLLEGNNLLCLAFEVVKTAAPNSLSKLFSVAGVPLQLLSKYLNLSVLDLDCPAFRDMMVGGTDFESGVLQRYPGAAKSSSAF